MEPSARPWQCRSEGLRLLHSIAEEKGGNKPKIKNKIERHIVQWFTDKWSDMKTHSWSINQRSCCRLLHPVQAWKTMLCYKHTLMHMFLHILELTAVVDFEARQNAASVHAHTASAAGKCTSQSPIHTMIAQQTTSIFLTILLPGLCHEPMHESFVHAT